MRSFILIPSLLIFSTLLFESCSDSNAAPETSSPAPRIVKTATVKTLNYQETVKASGQLALAEESRLGFKTGGIISKIYVREGQEVRKGQLLAEIEIDEISARAQQAELGQAQSEISVENAKLALRLAERDLRNAKGLYQDSVATLEQLEN
ncbi:MAG: biotin/lipoyl-binding protein, partial [Phaeodactylibacter sp.]|nr:biotin/lipoyl-binding protein [Phaeodactylibacter sp.]